MTDWESLRDEFAPLVWSVCARILKHQEDAADCFQDVFVEAIHRGRRGRVDDWGALLRWLATHRAIDALRRRRKTTDIRDIEKACDNGNAAEQKAHFGELVERVRGELAGLSPAQAKAFWLVCVEERTYEEVAQFMKIKRNAVGVLVHRARQRLKANLHSFDPSHTD